MIIYAESKDYQIPVEIDENDFAQVSQHEWRIDPQGYPRTRGKGRSGIRLHQLILGEAPVGLEWDHIDRDSCNNKRDNLRAVTHIVNQRNVGLRTDNTSGVRGVNKKGNTWQVRISIGPGDRLLIGTFHTFEEAKKARQDAEDQFWGTQR